MKKIALFLDVDGVLNQYRRSERIRRHRIDYDFCFAPFKKKVARLTKLVKKYNIDVYVFSAWTEENLQSHLPFKLSGDTLKWIKNVNKQAEEYEHSLLIDDEISPKMGKENGYGGEQVVLTENIITYKPHNNFGLVLKDFKKIDRILKELS